MKFHRDLSKHDKVWFRVELKDWFWLLTAISKGVGYIKGEATFNSGLVAEKSIDKMLRPQIITIIGKIISQQRPYLSLYEIKEISLFI